MEKKEIQIIISLVMGLLITLSSVFWISRTVTSESDLRNLWFGEPLSIAIQDQYGHYDPPSYPWKTSFTLPQENPTHWVVWGLLVDILFWAVIFGVLLRLFIRVRQVGKMAKNKAS